LAISQMPNRPTSLAQVNPGAWSGLGVGVIAIGTITRNGSGYIANYKLVDVYGSSGIPGSIIAQDSVSFSSLANINSVALKISNDIFDKLVSNSNPFSAKLTYVVYNPVNINSYSLYLAAYDGSNSKIIYESSNPIMFPHLVGNNLYFVTLIGTKSYIMLKNIVSQTERTVYKTNGTINGLTISNNNKTIIFSGTLENFNSNLFKINLLSGALSQLTFNNSGDIISPAFSADNSYIYYTYINSTLTPILEKVSISNLQNKVMITRNSNSAASGAGRYVYFSKNKILSRLNLSIDSSRVLSTRNALYPTVTSGGLMIVYISRNGNSNSLRLMSSNGYARVNLFTFNNSTIEFPSFSR
ncbi:MAG: hypothetical protein R3Y52_03000, partial [Psittacicella sp.]